MEENSMTFAATFTIGFVFFLEGKPLFPNYLIKSCRADVVIQEK